MTDNISKQVLGLMVAANTAAFDDFSEYEMEEDFIDFDGVGGRKVLGILSEEERKQFRIMIGVENLLTTRIEEAVSSINIAAAQKMIDRGGHLRPKDIEGLQQGAISAETKEEIYRLDAILNKVQADFWYGIRARLQTFATYLEITVNYRVVFAGSKS